MPKTYARGDAPPVFRSTDSATRKGMPVTEGVLGYFPDAVLCVALISRVGNDKHNPGQPLHWAKEKSTDESDCEVRHMLDHLRGIAPDKGLECLPGTLGHLASKAWRALAHLQRACDAEVAAWEAAQAQEYDSNMITVEVGMPVFADASGARYIQNGTQRQYLEPCDSCGTIEPGDRFGGLCAACDEAPESGS